MDHTLYFWFLRARRVWLQGHLLKENSLGIELEKDLVGIGMGVNYATLNRQILTSLY